MAEDKTFESEEERYNALRIVGQEAEAPDDFDPGDDDFQFEEVSL